MKTILQKLKNHTWLLAVACALISSNLGQAQNVFTNSATRPILACGEQSAIMLKSDGTVWTWFSIFNLNVYSAVVEGESQYAMSGINNWLVHEPCRIVGIRGAIAVAGGDDHFLVLKWDGTVLSFGLNNVGQLGIRNYTTVNVPTVISNLNSVSSISAGSDFSMAVLNDGRVMAWGNNANGCLGIGSSINKTNAPTIIQGLTNIFLVACGNRHALALATNGTVWAWGLNTDGQLGDGTTTTRSSPVIISNLSGIKDISAGLNVSYAITTNGNVMSWGRNDNGELGLGKPSLSQTNRPALITNLTNICQIRSAWKMTYAVSTEGKLWGWGYWWPYYLGDTPSGSKNVYTATQQVNLPNMQFIGSFGPKNQDNYDLFVAGLDTNGVLQNWGVANKEDGGVYTRHYQFSTPPTTNINWGYSTTYIGAPVNTNAYYRGVGDCADCSSFVIPIDFQAGVKLANVGGIATNILPFTTNFPFGYHYNSSNSDDGEQINIASRIKYQNPITAFGARSGGTAMRIGQSYRFAVFGGNPAVINDYPMLTNYDNALEIEIYSKSNYALVGLTNFPIPFELLTNGNWGKYVADGLVASFDVCGLKTTLTELTYPNAYGVTNNGCMLLSHFATEQATNYIFLIKYKGMVGRSWMALDGNANPTWQPLYTVEFEPSLPWNIKYLSQVQFEGKPLPPFYDGMSLSEVLSSSWKVTNVISLNKPMSNYTNLNNSPELRNSPVLDTFVNNLKNDPLAIARFVQDEIELTDAIDYLNQSNITTGQLNLGGVNRSAQATYLERQGSPVEQCSLLIYMLRKAGIPAAYAFPKTNGIQMASTRLSKMLRAQLKNALDSQTGGLNTNVVVSINYPWVVAYIGNQWVHLFPWIKDTEIIQGPNLYDYMPGNYNTAMKWVMGYIYNDPSIVGLGDTNDPPETLFSRFVQKQLLTNAPGISFDQLGIQAINRRHEYNTVDDFPTPTWVDSTNIIAENLSEDIITNFLVTSWNHFVLPASGIFNTAQIQIKHDGTNFLDSGVIRCCDIHDRTLLFYFERTNMASSKGLRAVLRLAEFSANYTNVSSFTNDGMLLNKQVVSTTFGSADPAPYQDKWSTVVTLNRYRVSGESDVIQRSMPVGYGDINAICLNFGRVSEQMLDPLAQTIKNMETLIKQDSSITNTMTLDQYQGPLIYLMGMSYYQKVDHFIPINAKLHGRSQVTDVGIGTAKLKAKLDSNGSLPAGPISYVQPCVDMAYNERFMVEAPTARPDSGEELNLGNDSFNLLTIADGSAKEHVAINHFFQQSDAISTVRLLQLTAERNVGPTTNQGILVVNHDNFNQITTNLCLATMYNYLFSQGWYSQDYEISTPGVMDNYIWNQVLNAVASSSESQALVTYGNTTNRTGSYCGTGALIIDPKHGSYAALISGNLNGGWGPYVPDYSFVNANLQNIWLGSSGAGNYSVNFITIGASYHPIAFDNFAPSQTLDIFNNASYLQFTYFNTLWSYQTAGYLGGSIPGQALNNTYANGLINSENNGFLGWLGDALKQVGSAVSDPVHVVSGEFFIDTADLTLMGPLPLEVRRNYSSLNTANNEFGTGWKLSFTPYMSMATNAAVMYAAEPDGSVLAYTPTPANTNLWVPTLAKNPQLVNNRKDGIGSTANLLLTKIVQTNQSGITNFYLYSPNGDIRNYQVASFSISNVVDRTRPYLASWLDARGNSLKFSYGTNSQAAEYGELTRVDSSSGAYIQFSYDIYGHILRALSNDGRQVNYEYDDYGDLVTVTLADASEIKYQYSHGYQPVTNSYTANNKKYTNVINQVYSFHLLTEKTDPDGRILDNTYDSQRRVIVQASTVAADCSLVTNATFTYSNDFVLTNSVTNTISGYTLLADVFNNVTRYDYTNSRITLITDPLNQTVQQDWYDENTNLPGYYPRSLWRTKDKRGLWTTFQYDSNGNITNTLTSGSLTGLAGTQTATNMTVYNSNNLPVMVIDAIGNSNVFRYDPVFPFLPRELVINRQGQAITTNAIFYGNATNVVTFGNTVWTNVAFGLPQMLVRAYGSTDAASNRWFYNGSGFATNEIRYTSTTDPAITNTLMYNARGELYRLIDAAGRSRKYDYDGLGRVISDETFETGQTIPMLWQNYYYNHNGDITWSDGPQYNPEDYVWFDYDGAGRKIAEAHWRSQAVADGSGVQAAPDDSLYSITTYEYDAFGNLLKQIDPVGNYSVMAYDTIGQLTKQVSYAANGSALSTNLMSREPGGQVANFTNSLGGITRTLYTQTGKPYFRQNPDGSTNGWSYDLLGRVQKEFLPNGSYWQTVYDDANRTVTRQFYNSANTLLTSTLQSFDRRGNVVTNITAQGGVFFNVYDGQDRLKVAGGPSASGGSSQQISYTYYDGAGMYVTNTDSVGRQTVTTYDAAHRPISTQTYDLSGGALISSQTSSYSPDEHAVTVTAGTSGAAIAKTTFVDSFNNVVLSQTYPGGSTTNYSISTYDLAERLSASQDELGQTTYFTYDGLGRLSTKLMPDGAQVQNGYNGEGGLTSMVMPGGLTWSATYNAANQRTGERLANGATVNRQFTNVFYTTGPLAGLLTSTIDLGRSVTNTFVYDDYRRVATNALTGSLPEHALTTSYQYDSGGLVTNLTQLSGVNPTTTILHAFDSYNQLTNEQVYIGGSLQYTFGQRWDAGGRRSVLQSPTAEFDYTYRVDGLPKSVAAFGSTYNFTYGNNGLLVSRSNPWRTLTVNSRDGQGRLLQQTATIGGGNALVETLTWRSDSTLNSYAATRSGTGSWNETRNYAYNSRGQLITEPIGISNSATATYGYGFDASKLGVLTSAQMSGALTNSWQATELNSLFQVTKETWSGAAKAYTASGWAGNAGSVWATLDSQPVTAALNSGSWYADLILNPGAHTLTASAYYPAGQFTNSAVSAFTVTGSISGVTNLFDGTGYVTNRLFADKTQTLTWDGQGRLLKVVQRDSAGNGFNWNAVYDALGRRLTTTNAPVTNGVIVSSQLTTINSYFDPQVEFQEVGVAVNGQRTWKVMGPDLNGGYGGLNGVGGLEATVRESDGLTTSVLNDYFGNVLATISGTTANWNTIRVNGYGPVGYQAPTLSASTPLAQTLLWRSRRMDPSGLYNLGARYYDPIGRNFLSPDPLGHASSMDLYSFANGDPVNGFDADGRFGKSPGDMAGRLGPTSFENQMNNQLADASYAISPAGQYMAAYHQTQADMARTLSWQPDPHTPGEAFSSMLNMTPVVGAFKMWWEGGVSGTDMVTGQRIDRGTWETIFGATANAVGAFGMMGGVMSEAAQGVRFSQFGATSFGAVENIPAGINYEGTVYRAVNSKYIDSAWDINANNIAANHRYSSVGRGALYTSTSEDAMAAEMSHYGIDLNTRSIVSKDISVDNILDLTNPKVRGQLGISLKQITSDDYFLTHALGDFSRSRYNGILAPSARKVGTSNLILFNGL